MAGNADERPHVLPGRRRIHQQHRPGSAGQAEIAAKGGVDWEGIESGAAAAIFAEKL